MCLFFFIVRLPRRLYRETMILWMQLSFTSQWKRRQWSGDCTGRQNWHNFAYEILMQSSQYLPLTLNQDKLSDCRSAVTHVLFWIQNVFLSRSQKNAKMTAFFRNNFSEDRWRKAALKNAFSLLGKQRFQHSAAFFLLAGSLKDAVEASGKKTWHTACKKHLFLQLQVPLVSLLNLS